MDDDIAPNFATMLAAAADNNGEAQYDLGLAYFNGDGVPQDYVVEREERARAQFVTD